MVFDVESGEHGVGCCARNGFLALSDDLASNSRLDGTVPDIVGGRIGADDVGCVQRLRSSITASVR